MVALKQALQAGHTIWAAGAYDALSAKLIEEAGFDAVFTSGLCVSASLLGLPDAELYTMSENLDVARRVANAIQVPLIVDGDTGYGNALNVMRTVREFEQAGAAAIVLEDQAFPKRCPAFSSEAALEPIDVAVGKIKAALDARRNPGTVIVARTDARDPAQALARAERYLEAGADLIQPISQTFSDITGLRQLSQACQRRVSLQAVGWIENLPATTLRELASVCVFPLVPLMTAVEAMRSNLAVLRSDLSTANLPNLRADHQALSRFLGSDRILELQQQYLPNPTQEEKK